MLDDYYSNHANSGHSGLQRVQGLDKKNFYLGSVVQVSSREVTIQIDNLSLLTHRLLRQSDLVPNTINYYVVIDSVSGIYFGQVVQNRIPIGASREFLSDESRKEHVYAEAIVDILGLEGAGDKSFRLPGFSRPGVTEKVYLANGPLIEHFVSSMELHIDEKDSSDDPDVEDGANSFACLSCFQDEALQLISPQTLFDRHLMVVGTTNSGKSTTALSVLDWLVNAHKKVLLIDPTGEYEDSFNPDEIKKLTLGSDTVVDSGSLSVLDWSMIFGCNENTQQGTLSDAIRSLRYQAKFALSGPFVKHGEKITEVQNKLSKVGREDTSFDVNLLPEQITEEAVEEGSKGAEKGKYTRSTFRINNYEWLREKILNQFDNTSFKQFFRNSGTDKNCKDLFGELDKFADEPKTSLYVNASHIGTTDGIGGMVVDLISNYLLNRPHKEGCAYVIFVDEVHRYAKKMTDQNSFYSGLTSIAREGRKKGIFLFLTTQNPNDVSSELLGQVGTLIIHRLTNASELGTIQNYVSDNTISQIMKLNQGEAILTSVNLLEDLSLSVRACGRPHKNDTPRL